MGRIIICCSLLAITSANFHSLSSAQEDGPALVERLTKRSTKDLPELRKGRVVRVLVNYNKTNFFNLGGQEKGFEYEQFVDYEKFLNEGVKREDQKAHIVFVPVPFERLIPALREGEGDIVAGSLTVTQSRQASVAFTDPYLKNVSEIVVTSPSCKGINTLQDLAGHTVYVNDGSSYAQHLRALSRKLEQRGSPAMKIVSPSDKLETEDYLELVHAGVFDITVADIHIAELWKAVFPDLVLRTDLVVNSGGSIAWAVRKNNPELLAHLNTFVKKNKKGTLLGNIFFKRYYKSTKWIKNPLTPSEKAKLERYAKIFQKHGKTYGYDWLLLAAQSYQESQLDQSVKSGAGAIGLMQLLPSTAKDMGITGIEDPDKNVEAGTKYMRWLGDNFFNDPSLAPDARVDLCLAAYNAGPGRVRGWRKKATTRGLDPNKWFFNVERVALEDGVLQTVRYLSNINKYYISYKMIEQIRQDKAKVMSRGK